MNRATLDPNVVEEWRLGTLRCRRIAKWLMALVLAVFMLALAPPFLGWVGFFPYVVIASAVALVVLVMLKDLNVMLLECPHCGEWPVYKGKRTPLYSVDFCMHCNYWLIDPKSHNRA